MARGGINKALVQKARMAILARGENPSIDALRVELGNTGSKTTIHRYLKELEAEAGGTTGHPLSLSEELGNLVTQLAERLQQEARDSVAEDRARLSRERLDFHAVSDSAIVSGLIYLALRVYSGRPAAEILATDPDYIADIGLARHLSPTRSNGLASLLAFIRDTARAQA